MTNQTTVHVVHEERDGYHLLTSKTIKGLRVGSRDLRAAYDDVPSSIQYLMKANYGIDCLVTPEKTFDEFAAGVEAIDPAVAEVRPFHLVHAAAQ